MLKRYPPAHVDEAIAQAQGGRIEPHSAIVLAAEVLALREQYATDRVCPMHAIRMFVAYDGRLICWHCVEGAAHRRLMDAVATLIACDSQAQVDAAVAELKRLVYAEGVL